MRELILASASPRRKELLLQLGIPFSVEIGNVDEESVAKAAASPKETVCLLAEAKAKKVLENKRDTTLLVLGADTVVAQGNHIFHKPKNEAEAFSTLTALSGKKHTVYTGFALLKQTEQSIIRHVEAVGTDVYFRPLTEKEILAYIATGEPMDKAGAYGIQGKGAFLADHIEGDYNAVVGLPLSRLCCAFRQMGVEITDFWKEI